MPSGAMFENVENCDGRHRRKDKIKNVKKHLSKVGHRVSEMFRCPTNKYIPAPSFRRFWKNTRDFICRIPDEMFLSSSADINYYKFFTEEEKRFEN